MRTLSEQSEQSRPALSSLRKLSAARTRQAKLKAKIATLLREQSTLSEEIDDLERELNSLSSEWDTSWTDLRNEQAKLAAAEAKQRASKRRLDELKRSAASSLELSVEDIHLS